LGRQVLQVCDLLTSSHRQSSHFVGFYKLQLIITTLPAGL
jgi:hypothetical protein